MAFTAADWDGIATEGFITDNWTVIATDGIFFSLYVPPVITTPSWRKFIPEAKSRTLFVAKDDRKLIVPAVHREVDFGRQNKQVVLP